MKNKTKSQNPGTLRRKAASTTAILTGESGANSINPKWLWHYRVLLGLRDRLLMERGEKLAQAAERLEPHSMHRADSATDEFDHDLALSQLSAGQDVLYEVDEALNRIRNGTYGLCEETGKPILAERLKAIPWTRFMAGVEARLEKQGVLPHPHLGRLASARRSERATLVQTSEEVERKEATSEKE
jgi:RNA polymerase-binding transcription factor DksA